MLCGNYSHAYQFYPCLRIVHAVINAFYTKLKTLKARASRPDLIFALLVLFLAAYGTAMVFSAGFYYAEARYGDGYYFIKRQGIWLLLGCCAMIVTSMVDVRIYKKATPVVYLCTLALLITVLIFGFVGNGAQRWISIGPITIQPSEIAKIALILALARYFDDSNIRRRSRIYLRLHGRRSKWYHRARTIYRLYKRTNNRMAKSRGSQVNRWLANASGTYVYWLWWTFWPWLRQKST